MTLSFDEEETKLNEKKMKIITKTYREKRLKKMKESVLTREPGKKKLRGKKDEIFLTKEETNQLKLLLEGVSKEKTNETNREEDISIIPKRTDANDDQYL